MSAYIGHTHTPGRKVVNGEIKKKGANSALDD